ncbi:MAG: SDR family oxidoreductase [Planctomycetota bacterium]|nr:MAG: SDR family oxidoreductase [Planctomycetota bacterium]
MRIVVAGCAGFVGYHLAARLLRDGNEVLGVDNLATGQQKNAADLRESRAFTFLRHDITTPLDIDGPVDQVYNLACPASPADFRDKNLEIMAVCSRGIWNLLDLCAEKSARLLHTSTSEVYGDPKEHPQRESYWGNVNPIGPRSCYDEGKRFAEALITHYRTRRQVQARIARIFNTYGPRMRRDDGRVLPNFISQALRGEPLTVHGDGSQTRSFCYVDDMVEGLIRLMNSDVDAPVNLGNPEEITILEFARQIVRLADSDSEVRLVPRPPDDPQLRRPDITRATELLGWSPRVDRDDGLRRTIDWFRHTAS